LDSVTAALTLTAVKLPDTSRAYPRAVPTYAALIRGINVGGRARLAMPLLRAGLTELGFESVVTYIQSGNAVFRAAGRPAEVAQAVERRILKDAGLTVTVMVRTHAELSRIAKRNPFVADEQEPRHLHVLFLDRAPSRSAVHELDADRSPPDRFHVEGQAIYLHHPNGLGRSRLSADYFEKILGVRATARNWNTVLKLVELTAS
jgi:uncharacterized protein (DUF1697 family)